MTDVDGLVEGAKQINETSACPRFICLDHALRQYCMSCATKLAASNYIIDPDCSHDEAAE